MRDRQEVGRTRVMHKESLLTEHSRENNKKAKTGRDRDRCTERKTNRERQTDRQMGRQGEGEGPKVEGKQTDQESRMQRW